MKLEELIEAIDGEGAVVAAFVVKEQDLLLYVADSVNEISPRSRIELLNKMRDVLKVLIGMEEDDEAARYFLEAGTKEGWVENEG